MKKWRSRLFAILMAVCMSIGLTGVASATPVFAATKTAYSYNQFEKKNAALKKNSKAEKKALKLIKGTWYTVGGAPYHNKYVFSGKTVKLYAPGAKKSWKTYKIDKVTKTSYGYYYRIYLGRGYYDGWRLVLKDKATLQSIGNGKPYSTAGYSGTSSLVRKK